MHKEWDCPSWGQQRAGWVTACTYTHRGTHTANLCCLQATHTSLPRWSTAALCTHPAHLLCKLGKRQPQDPPLYFKREQHFNAEALWAPLLHHTACLRQCRLLENSPVLLRPSKQHCLYALQGAQQLSKQLSRKDSPEASQKMGSELCCLKVQRGPASIWPSWKSIPTTSEQRCHKKSPAPATQMSFSSPLATH